jgi:Flp pilus assembly protein TadG
MLYSRINRWSDERGTTAVEFALVSPIFFLLTIGIIYLCMTLWAVGSLHYAVEAGARCASVQPWNGTQHDCTNSSATTSYTLNHYYGPSTPQFTMPTPAVCGGYAVKGIANYVINLGLTQITVPISATACFP